MDRMDTDGNRESSKQASPNNGSPVSKFAWRFAGFTLGFYALALIPGWDAMLATGLTAHAHLGARLLNGFGEPCQVFGNSIWSASHGITVEPGCSALEYPAFLCAAVFSFPAPLDRKVPGALAGVALLLAANLVRITSLYWIGVHSPAFFDTAHLVLWPCLLVVLTIGIVAGWLHWIPPRHEFRRE